MADRSLIEWTDATWNPITGCTPVSAGCQNCYAKRMTRRFHVGHIGPFENINFYPDRLDQPLRWKKPRRIFVCSMGDLFHENVPSSEICNVFRIVKRCPRHTFMVLTKRPERMEEFINDYAEVFPNLWLGVTAENQEMAGQRIPILLQTPAAKRFVSIEPCLGPVDLSGWGAKMYLRTIGRDGSAERPGLDWCIVGGESGPGARPMHQDWPRSLRDQCQAAGVPFFFKQWGEWGPVYQMAVVGKGPIRHHWPDKQWSTRVGKKAAGCLLDGREWKEFPR